MKDPETQSEINAMFRRRGHHVPGPYSTHVNPTTGTRIDIGPSPANLVMTSHPSRLNEHARAEDDAAYVAACVSFTENVWEIMADESMKGERLAAIRRELAHFHRFCGGAR